MANATLANLLKTGNFLTETGGGGVSLREAAAEGAARLQQAQIKTPVQDAELLLLHATGLGRTDLITRPEQALTRAQEERYRELIARRERFEPIQYIIGEREFYGLRFAVSPDVLIPRPETEHLVEAALERIPIDAPMRIADIGTGSGAIAVALAFARPMTQITALDISPAALKVAAENAAAHRVADRISFREADLLGNASEGEFDMVVSNPPYIADGERDTLDAEVRNYEPAAALFAGPTGLEIYKMLIPNAARVLRPGGWLIMEIGAGQQLQLQLLLEGWQEVSFVSDLQGIARVAIGRVSKKTVP